jgi:lipoprotein-anchoring transpeptidase ErfK/SrfK
MMVSPEVSRARPSIPSAFALRFASAVFSCTVLLNAQTPSAIQNAEGLRLFVAPENTQPALRVGLPDNPGTIEVESQWTASRREAEPPKPTSQK